MERRSRAGATWPFQISSARLHRRAEIGGGVGFPPPHHRNQLKAAWRSLRLGALTLYTMDEGLSARSARCSSNCS